MAYGCFTLTFKGDHGTEKKSSVGKVDRMKTDAAGWPRRHHADARPPGTALFGVLVWRRRLGSVPDNQMLLD